MASHLEEKCSHPISEIEVQNCSASGEKECSKKGKAVEEFDCVTVKNVLAPMTVCCTPLETKPGLEQQAKGSPVKETTKYSNDETGNFVQQASTNGQTIKRKRTTEGNYKKMYFRLSKFQNGNEQYIFKVHDQITSCVVNSYHVKLENKGGEKWSVGIYDLDEKIEHSANLMEEDADPPIFHKKYNLPLLERLNGWTLENRKREKGRVDKFYYHQTRQFRSLVEVAGFILYSSKPKDLKPLTTIVTVPEPREIEAATAMILLSNVEAFDTHAQRLDNGAVKECENASLGGIGNRETT